MSIELHIERLVVDAAVLGSEPPASVRAVIERALARQLALPGAIDKLRGIGAVDRLPPVSAGSPREAPGARIAAAVGTGLGLPLMAASPAHSHRARTRS